MRAFGPHPLRGRPHPVRDGSTDPPYAWIRSSSLLRRDSDALETQLHEYDGFTSDHGESLGKHGLWRQGSGGDADEGGAAYWNPELYSAEDWQLSPWRRLFEEESFTVEDFSKAVK